MKYSQSALSSLRNNLTTRENLHQHARADSNQGAVWDEVNYCLQAVQTSSATMALNDVVKKHKDSLDSYVRALGYPTRARGVVAAINGKFAVMDLFDKPETLEKVWPRLVSAYALDALVRTGDPTMTFIAKGARSLLEHVGELECCAYPSVDLGEDWRFQAPDIVGQALVVQDTCVQLSIFHNAEENRDANPEFRIMSPSYRRGHRGRIY